MRLLVLWFVVPWNKRQQLCACLFYCHRYGKQASANHFEESMGPRWLEGVSCSGKEASFLQCSRGPWGRHACSHREDVGISCYPGGNGFRVSLGEVLPQLLTVHIPVATAHLATGLWLFKKSIFPDALIFSNFISEKNSLLRRCYKILLLIFSTHEPTFLMYLKDRRKKLQCPFPNWLLPILPLTYLEF